MRKPSERASEISLEHFSNAIRNLWNMKFKREREKLIPKFPLTAAELLMAKNLKCEKKGIRCETNIGAPKCHLASLNSFCCCIYVMALVIALFIFRSDRLVSERSCHVFPNGEVKFTLPSIIGTPARRGWFIPHPCFCIFFCFLVIPTEFRRKGSSQHPLRARALNSYINVGVLLLYYTGLPRRGRFAVVYVRLLAQHKKNDIYIYELRKEWDLGRGGGTGNSDRPGGKNQKNKTEKTVQEEPPVAYMHMYAAVLFPNLGKEQKVIL